MAWQPQAMFPDGKRMKAKGVPRSLEACLIREQPTFGDRAPGGDGGFWAAVGGGARPSQAWIASLVDISQSRELTSLVYPGKRPSSSKEDPSNGEGCGLLDQQERWAQISLACLSPTAEAPSLVFRPQKGRRLRVQPGSWGSLPTLP